MRCQVRALGHCIPTAAYAIHHHQAPPSRRAAILRRLVRCCQPRRYGARFDRTPFAATQLRYLRRPIPLGVLYRRNVVMDSSEMRTRQLHCSQEGFRSAWTRPAAARRYWESMTMCGELRVEGDLMHCRSLGKRSSARTTAEGYRQARVCGSEATGVRRARSTTSADVWRWSPD